MAEAAEVEGEGAGAEAGSGADPGPDSGSDEFEKRGVSIALFRAVRALALERDATFCGEGRREAEAPAL